MDLGSYRPYIPLLVVAAIGVGIMGYGLWIAVAPEPSSVEISSGQESTATGSGERAVLYVDVAGAVEKPGVYKIPSGSRVGDSLVVAGGLAAEADREWVAKTLNLAAEVKDGQKIYVPAKAADRQVSVSASQQISDSVSQPASSEEVQNSNVNINTATVQELDSLWGIGEARANTIITNRPYAGVEELLSKAKIPQNVYDKIKDRVSVY